MHDSSSRNSTERAAPAPIGGGAGAPRGGPIPLVVRFPALAMIPRVAFGVFPTPVEPVDTIPTRGGLWIKRDDESGRTLADDAVAGGNKLRALEFVLGSVRAGETIVVLGGEGSTHVLATAVLARRLGARTIAVRWRHDMNDVAREVARRAARACERVHTTGSVPAALLVRVLHRDTRAARPVPFGGTSVVGMLGHVNAALELADQIDAGALPRPARIVVPLGTGGTAAGLALGLAITGLDATIVAVRVVPRIIGRRSRVLSLADRCARFIERRTGGVVPRVPAHRVIVDHRWFGGAYGRPLPAAGGGIRTLERATGIRLDDTYGAKAWAGALAWAERASDPTVFWMTFDPRRLAAAPGA